MSPDGLPFAALRAFDAAVRHGSFSRAAMELGVSQAAVSQHIVGLEARLGRRLFERTNRGVRATEAAEMLRPVVGSAFGQMADALASLSVRRSSDELIVTTTPIFASAWLVARLGRFAEEDLGFELRIAPTLDFVDIAGGAADVAIRCGAPPWSGLEVDLLVPIHMVPVCSPALLLEARAPIASAGDLLDLPILHADAGSHPRGEEWRLWLSEADTAHRTAPPSGQVFRDPGLSLQAAVAGLGIAMGYRELAEADILAGRLVCPVDRPVRHPFSYYLVTPRARRDDPRITAFRKWILTEARRSNREPGANR